ncbi:hypothetical protein MES4922_400009 [Mesorhizobium ventifaucium]|uniref:Uncharacterized protein n=2 Tax=Mesorhizobium TaxID=68287 RepID=A0ABN8K8V8_9HYPH|nr:hypothetical protein MES5069_100029 [Mesorhizobium escarrei]CAH2405846.1 hypothetical protein MES4922_400009 [Mesorhizobium ventifaucium]
MTASRPRLHLLHPNFEDEQAFRPSQERAKLEAELREMTRDLAPKLLRVALEQIRVLKTLS